MQCWREGEGGKGGSMYISPGPEYIAYDFVFLGSIIICRLSKSTLSDQDRVTLQQINSLSELV